MSEISVYLPYEECKVCGALKLHTGTLKIFPPNGEETFVKAHKCENIELCELIHRAQLEADIYRHRKEVNNGEIH